jgi:hypothetical protein
MSWSGLPTVLPTEIPVESANSGSALSADRMGAGTASSAAQSGVGGYHRRFGAANFAAKVPSRGSS